MGFVCSTKLFRFRKSKWYICYSYYYHHLLRNINRSQFCHIFLDVFLRWLCHDILSVFHIHLGKFGLCFCHYCAAYDVCKQSDTLWPEGRIHLFPHYTISLSWCRLILRHCIYMCCKVTWSVFKHIDDNCPKYWLYNFHSLFRTKYINRYIYIYTKS